MPNWGGAASGAASGALAGSSAGPYGAIAGGLIGGVTGLLSSDPSKSLASQANNSVLGNIPKQVQTGSAAVDSGLTGLGNAGRYYNTLIGGNKDAISTLLNPQVSTVLAQYDNAAKAVKEFAPRGGGATATLAATPFQKATTAGQVYQTAVPGAAQGAAGVGGAQAGIGTSLLGQVNGTSDGLLGWQKHLDDLTGAEGKGLATGAQNVDFKSAGAKFGGILGKIFGGKNVSGGGGSGVDPSLLGGD